MRHFRFSILIATALFVAIPALLEAQENHERFDKFFYNKTLRVDFYHCGSNTSEFYCFDEMIEEPFFAGSKESLINPFDYGMQMFKLFDTATGELIYKNNYCTLFTEWQCTPEAHQTTKAMPEGIVIPYPKKEARLEIYSRGVKTGTWEKKFEYIIHPDSYFIRPFKPKYEVFDITVNGPSEHCVDIVLLPEGFAAGDREDFEKACTKWSNALFHYAPFSQYKQKFNIRAVWVPSPQSGVSIPGQGIWKETAMKAHFYTFDSERYQMTEDFQRVRDLAANAPYDYVYILSNTDKYGGGGIYNFYGLSSTKHAASSEKVYVHEFGHQLLGLGDEYVEENNTTSDMYYPGVEPYEANLTNLTHFDKKWKSMLPKGTVIPTPMDTIGSARDMSKWKLGVYEGGGYMSKGMYRPMPNCMMNIIHTIDEFCPVCQKAIRDYLDYMCK